MPPDSPDFTQMKIRDESSDPVSATGQKQDPSRSAVAELAGNLVVSLSARETTWVSLVTDGQNTFAGLLKPGDTRDFQATDRLRLRIGNAGGIEIRWNGRPIGPIGQQGEVCFVNFTPEGFGIRRVEM
jgi:hypothetical protein